MLTLLTPFFLFIINFTNQLCEYICQPQPHQLLQPCISHSVCMHDYTYLFPIKQPPQILIRFCVLTKSPASATSAEFFFCNYTELTPPTWQYCSADCCFGGMGSLGKDRTPVSVKTSLHCMLPLLSPFVLFF